MFLIHSNSQFWTLTVTHIIQIGVIHYNINVEEQNTLVKLFHPQRPNKAYNYLKNKK